MDFTSDVEHVSDFSDVGNGDTDRVSALQGNSINNLDAVKHESQVSPLSSPVLGKVPIVQDDKICDFHGFNMSNGSGSGSSDSEDALLLSKEERERLELEQEKESLLRERDSLLRVVDSLKKELKSETNKADVLRFEEGDPNAGLSVNVDLADNDDMETDVIDDNAADTLVGLLTLSSNEEKRGALQFFRNGSLGSHLQTTTLSAAQTELVSRCDCLPLLNMQLRLRYLEKYLYPNMKLEVHELRRDDTVTTSSGGNSSTHMASVTFDRPKLRLFFKFLFTTLDASTRNNTQSQAQAQGQNQTQGHNNTLIDFGMLDVSPKRFTRTVNKFIRRYPHNPVTLLFCLAEYERLIFLRDELIQELYLNYSNWISEASMGHYTDTCRRIRFQKHDSISDRVLLIDFKISLDNDDVNNNDSNNSNVNAIRVSIPSTEIDLTFIQNGRRVVDPDINDIFAKLLREYGLQQSLMEIVQVVLFPR